MTKVFVYGTLKHGRGNHGTLGDSDLVGVAHTKKEFGLANVGFPYLTPATRADEEGLPVHQVKGELYNVHSDAVLTRLDILEGVRYGHYTKETITVMWAGEEVEALAYVVGEDTSIAHLPSCQVDGGYLVY